MSAPREALLVSLLGLVMGAAGASLEGSAATLGDWTGAIAATALAAAGAWACARRLGFAVAAAGLVAAAYATSGTFRLERDAGAFAAAALPWIVALAPEARPGPARLVLMVGLLAFTAPPALLVAAAPDLVALGAWIALAGALIAARRAPFAHAQELAFALAIVLAVLVLRRGPDPGWSLALAPGGWGATVAPGAAAPARAWVAAPVVLLALAALFDERATRRFGPLVPVAIVAWGLALGLPGLADTWRSLPLFGEAACAGLAPLAALGLALLAGHAIERRAPRERLVALGLAAPLVVFAPADPPPAAPEVPDDEWVTTPLGTPRGIPRDGGSSFTVWIHAELPVEGAGLRLVPADGGPSLDLETERGVAPPPAEFLPEGREVALLHAAEPVDTRRLRAGAWTVATVLRLDDRQGGTTESVRPFATVAAGTPRRPGADLAGWVLAALVLLVPGTGRWRWLALGAVVALGWQVAGVLLLARP